MDAGLQIALDIINRRIDEHARSLRVRLSREAKLEEITILNMLRELQAEILAQPPERASCATFEPADTFERRPLDAPDPEQPSKKYDWYPKSTDRGGDHE